MIVVALGIPDAAKQCELIAKPGAPVNPDGRAAGGGRDAKVWLEPDIALAESYGFNPRELSVILRAVAENRDLIVRAWRDHFGI